MKITVTKKSKDGLLEVTMTKNVKGNDEENASAVGSRLHTAAEKVVDDRFKAMRAKAKSKEARRQERSR